MIAPSFTANDQLGMALEGLGYYKILSENWDVIARGTILSLWRLDFEQGSTPLPEIPLPGKFLTGHAEIQKWILREILIIHPTRHIISAGRTMQIPKQGQV